MPSLERDNQLRVKLLSDLVSEFPKVDKYEDPFSMIFTRASLGYDVVPVLVSLNDDWPKHIWGVCVQDGALPKMCQVDCFIHTYALFTPKHGRKWMYTNAATCLL